MTTQCRECGNRITGPRKAKFCSTACRQSFNNRRLQRGAELYDLFMTLRYDRSLAKKLNVWTLLCRMAQQMRDEDVRARGGRNSWQSASTVLENRADLHAVIVATKVR